MSKRRLFSELVDSPTAKLFRSLNARRVLWGAIFFICTTLILGINFVPKEIDLEEGQPSPQDIYAEQTIRYESQYLTEQARKDAAQTVEPVYKVDSAVLRSVQEDLRKYFEPLLQAKTGDFSDEKSRIAWLKDALPVEAPDWVLVEIIQSDTEVIGRMETISQDIVRRSIENGVQKEAVSTAKGNMLSLVTNSDLDEHSKVLVTKVIQELEIRPNLVYDAAGTADKRESIRNQVAPVLKEIRQRQKIVGKGDIVTPEQIEALQKLGLLRSRSPLPGLVGLSLLILITYVAVFLYLYQYQRRIFENEHLTLLVGLLMVITLLIGRAVTAINLGARPDIAAVVGYVIPLAAGSMLIAILLDASLAIFLTLVLGIFIGIMTGTQLQFAITAIVGGLAGVYSVSKLSQRWDLARASMYIMAANMVTILALGLMRGHSLTTIAVGMGLGISCGILSSVLTIGLLPFFETAFGITTSVKLLELSNPNHPLLKSMLMEAPGTYHHSILVGNLAESAADAVGADSLLARVGAYYHDIGKVKRPYFFIENQLGADNPHDKLAPTLSTLVITSHIKDGMEMARDHQLPPSIVDFIEQHHGTSLISYFYYKAAESDRCESISEDSFRYESRKPQSKEVAIVMLSDSVEAAVRAMQNPNPGKMEGTVRRIIKEKFEDGQLEECDLNFKELDVIAQAFMRLLGGIFHSRVEYPDSLVKEMERRKAKDATIRKQPAG
ncbi:MAG: HD family phosphohydrolase [Bacillota bacterium]